MKIFILALAVMSTVSVVAYLEGEMAKIEKDNAAAYMMVKDLTLLKTKPECFTSLKGVNDETTPLAVRLYYDFMRITYFMNLLDYDLDKEDKKTSNNVFAAIMKGIGVDPKEKSAGKPGPNGKIGCNHYDLHKRAKEKLGDYCKLDFVAIKEAVAKELKAQTNLETGCADKIKKMFEKIREERDSMTGFNKKYLHEMVPMLNHEFLMFSRKFFGGDYSDKKKFKFVMIYEMMKFEQARSSTNAEVPINKGQIAIPLKGFIETIKQEAARELPTIGIDNLIKDLNDLIAITDNTGPITPKLKDEFTQFIRSLVPNFIVLV